jgi:hypothetical protein
MQQKTRPTNLDIAQTDDYYSCWAEYVDPNATMTPAEHAAMSIEERLEILVDMFGDDRSFYVRPGHSIPLGAKLSAIIADRIADRKE